MRKTCKDCPFLELVPYESDDFPPIMYEDRFCGLHNKIIAPDALLDDPFITPKWCNE